MKKDIEIAHSTPLKRIDEVAQTLGIDADNIEHYGKHIAKLPLSLINEDKKGKLILVTAITATRAGIGKTTVSIGLALGLNALGKKACVALREPSLGPCFGMKGGAAGGGYAQVLPMERINLHFTGDFHAITSAHNMIAALLDNYLYQHQKEGFGLKEILWRRVLDVNDRSLRSIVTGLGPATNGITQQAGFDITPASELMAILCLAKDEKDLRRRIENILLGYTYEGLPFTVRDLGVAGAIMVLLKDAIQPNLVQTTENTPAIVHGGPFANIAHGCNSLIATKMSLSHAEYTITEAGFGADLGAEKFYNILCRKSGLTPDLTVIVATAQGLKMHGGVELDKIKEPNEEGLRAGLANLDRHVKNLQSFGQSVLVVFNHFAGDTVSEMDMLREHCEKHWVCPSSSTMHTLTEARVLSTWRSWWLTPSKTSRRKNLCTSLTTTTTPSAPKSRKYVKAFTVLPASALPNRLLTASSWPNSTAWLTSRYVLPKRNSLSRPMPRNMAP